MPSTADDAGRFLLVAGIVFPILLVLMAIILIYLMLSKRRYPLVVPILPQGGRAASTVPVPPPPTPVDAESGGLSASAPANDTKTAEGSLRSNYTGETTGGLNHGSGQGSGALALPVVAGTGGTATASDGSSGAPPPLRVSSKRDGAAAGGSAVRQKSKT